MRPFVTVTIIETRVAFVLKIKGFLCYEHCVRELKTLLGLVVKYN